MPETTEPQLSESDVQRIESHLHLTTDGDAVSVLAEVPALIRDWRALRAALSKCDEIVVEAVRKNAALREQLAQVTEERRQWLIWADALTGNQHYLPSKMRIEIATKLGKPENSHDQLNQ